MNRHKIRSRSSGSHSFVTRRWEKKSRKRLYLTIIIVGILLYSFFTWFMPALIGGLSFVNQFKSTPAPQTPVSENITLAPPVLNIPFEATNSAVIQIKGYASPNTSVKIYVDDDLKSTTKTSDGGDFVSDEITLSLGTNNIYGEAVDDKDNKSLPSKTIRLIYGNEKPELSLESPSDNQTVSGGDKKVSVTGKVSPKEGMSVTINGMIIILKDNGGFSQTVDINEGDNNIIVIAKDRTGNIAQITRNVIYTP